MSIYNIANIDVSKVTIGNAVRNTEDGGSSQSIKYNGTPLKFRIPAGVISGFYQLPDTFHYINGVNEATPNAKLGCKIVFDGCDPLVKSVSVVETPVSSAYNFVLSLQNQIVKNAVENSVKLFGRPRSEEAIRECLHGIKIGRRVRGVHGDFVPDGKTPPLITAAANYSDIVGSGDARMSLTDDAGSTPYLVVSPTIMTKEFCMVPYIQVIQQGLHIHWNVEYDTTNYVFEV